MPSKAANQYRQAIMPSKVANRYRRSAEALLGGALSISRKNKKRDLQISKSLFLTPYYSKYKLLVVLALSDNLFTLVEAAILANSECKVVFAALRALNKVGGLFKLPVCGASFVLSCVRNLSLRNCHR